MNLVVFLPGYTGQPPERLNPLLNRMKSGYTDTLSVAYAFFGRVDITASAKRALKAIAPLRAHYDHITLIGHSMGGLVARKVLAMDPDAADALVTIGSPHNGTSAARRPFWWMGGHSVSQMQPDSKFLKYLPEPTVPSLTFTGTWDVLVRDGSLPGADNVKINYGEHTLMLFSDKIFYKITSWLKDKRDDS